MRIGIDLDNTIVSYDQLFARLSRERDLVPSHIPPTKQAIRDYLRAQGVEDRWTELQGIAYGSRMDEAIPFDGVLDFFARCEAVKVEWLIISHRTQVPFLGEKTDLHAAAREWLLKHGFISHARTERVKLAISKEAKLREIGNAHCDVFIDDLPELLCDPIFPLNVRRILFDPADQNLDRPEYERSKSWADITLLLGL